MSKRFHLVLVVSESRPSWYSLMDIATGDEIVLTPTEEKRMKHFMLRLIERSVKKVPALVHHKEYSHAEADLNQNTKANGTHNSRA